MNGLCHMCTELVEFNVLYKPTDLPDFQFMIQDTDKQNTAVRKQVVLKQKAIVLIYSNYRNTFGAKYETVCST